MGRRTRSYSIRIIALFDLLRALLILNGGQRRDRTAAAGLFRAPTNGPKWLRISGPD